MEDKIYSIQLFLAKELPERKLIYEFSNEFHKFKLKGKHNTHWLYLPRELVDDEDIDKILESITKYKIVIIFNESSSSKWFFLGSDGLREVDENFTKS